MIIVNEQEKSPLSPFERTENPGIVPIPPEKAEHSAHASGSGSAGVAMPQTSADPSSSSSTSAVGGSHTQFAAALPSMPLLGPSVTSWSASNPQATDLDNTPADQDQPPPYEYEPQNESGLQSQQNVSPPGAPMNTYSPGSSTPGGFYAPNQDQMQSQFSQNLDSKFPSCFSRPPPPTVPHSSFLPIFLLANGSHIKKGFPICPPPYKSQNGATHPFVLHDVKEEDWTRFITDLHTAAQLTKGERNFAQHIPVLSIVPILNVVVSSSIKYLILTGKGKPTSAAVDTWNRHFFHPRNLEVILMKGAKRLSGPPDAPVPNLNLSQPAASNSLLDPRSSGGTRTSISSLARMSSVPHLSPQRSLLPPAMPLSHSRSLSNPPSRAESTASLSSLVSESSPSGVGRSRTTVIRSEKSPDHHSPHPPLPENNDSPTVLEPNRSTTSYPDREAPLPPPPHLTPFPISMPSASSPERSSGSKKFIAGPGSMHSPQSAHTSPSSQSFPSSSSEKRRANVPSPPPLPPQPSLPPTPLVGLSTEELRHEIQLMRQQSGRYAKHLRKELKQEFKSVKKGFKMDEKTRDRELKFDLDRDSAMRAKVKVNDCGIYDDLYRLVVVPI